MAAGIPLWQWAATSVLVPIAIGVGSAAFGYALSLRKARFDLRLVDRRRSYNALLPSLAELVAYDSRALRLAYHEFGSQAAEDRARESDAEWAERYATAMTVINGSRAKGELGSSRQVLDALNSLADERERIRQGVIGDTLEFVDAHEMDAAASLAALDAVQKAVAREA